MWETKQICYVSILLPSSDINVWLTRAALTEHSWLISCSIHTFLFSFYSKNCEILLNLLLHKFWDLAVLFCSNSPQPCEHLSHFSGHLLEFTAVPFFFLPNIYQTPSGGQPQRIGSAELASLTSPQMCSDVIQCNFISTASDTILTGRRSWTERSLEQNQARMEGGEGKEGRQTPSVRAGELQGKNNNILDGFNYNFQVSSLYEGLTVMSFLK